MQNEKTLAKVKLLIADDENIEKMYLHRFLLEQFSDQCQIFQAENGREALQIFMDEQIQISILDIEMPGMNGIEAAAEMKRQDPNCCIIFLTAYDEFSYARKAVSIHALDYLLKPYQEEELLAVVEEAIRITQTKDQKYGRTASQSELSQETLDALSEEESSGKYGDIKEVILQYLMKNYQADISMQEVARSFHYSEAHFCKLFKQVFQTNFTVYLTQLRIEKAKQLLDEKQYNVKEVGEAVGYGDANYFTKVFRRITGKSPSEYRLCIMYKDS
jgi:YesN/AraC family two-component response regulator